MADEDKNDKDIPSVKPNIKSAEELTKSKDEFAKKTTDEIDQIKKSVREETHEDKD